MLNNVPTSALVNCKILSTMESRTRKKELLLHIHGHRWTWHGCCTAPVSTEDSHIHFCSLYSLRKASTVSLYYSRIHYIRMYNSSSRLITRFIFFPLCGAEKTHVSRSAWPRILQSLARASRPSSLARSHLRASQRLPQTQGISQESTRGYALGEPVFSPQKPRLLPTVYSRKGFVARSHDSQIPIR